MERARKNRIFVFRNEWICHTYRVLLIYFSLVTRYSTLLLMKDLELLATYPTEFEAELVRNKLGAGSLERHTFHRLRERISHLRRTRRF
jgi:hypothetical protein